MSSPICPMPLAEIFRDIFGKEKETNKVKILYDDAFKADIGRWIASCAVIGLAAGIISKNPSQGLLAAAAYNLAVVWSNYYTIKLLFTDILSGSPSLLYYQNTSQTQKHDRPKASYVVRSALSCFNSNVASCSGCHVCQARGYKCL